MGFYSIEEIRKIQNKPFSYLTFSSSEFGLVIQLTLMSFLVGVVLQFVFNLIKDNPPQVLNMVILFGFCFSIIIIKAFNKRYGKGVIFFIMADIKKFFLGKKEIKRKTPYEIKEI